MFRVGYLKNGMLKFFGCACAGRRGRGGLIPVIFSVGHEWASHIFWVDLTHPASPTIILPDPLSNDKSVLFPFSVFPDKVINYEISVHAY